MLCPASYVGCRTCPAPDTQEGDQFIFRRSLSWRLSSLEAQAKYIAEHDPGAATTLVERVMPGVDLFYGVTVGKASSWTRTRVLGPEGPMSKLPADTSISESVM